MIEAAIAGLGLAVVPTLMVERQIANGNLRFVGGAARKKRSGIFRDLSREERSQSERSEISRIGSFKKPNR